jgi:F-type H+-transporting ATPase subunit b
MSDLLNDPMFFYTVAFAIFIAIAVRFTRKPLINWLDSEIAKIRDELENAKKLRTEAEAVLADYKKKRASAMAEAEGILKHAAEQAAQMKTQAEADLKTSLARHAEQARSRIALAEAEAIAAVRTATITLAVEKARQVLAIKIDPATAGRLAEQAIAELPKLAEIKAKAA